MDESWIVPQTALDSLVRLGASRPEAWHLLADAMRSGQIRCQAASQIWDWHVGPNEQRTDQEVPCDAWIWADFPAPGHTFWRIGDVLLHLRLPGTQTEAQALVDVLSFAPAAPTVEIRGAKLDRDGLELLTYQYSQKRGSPPAEDSSPAKPSEKYLAPPQTPKSRGRPRGAGSYAALDAPLVEEMIRLINSGVARSPHHAAQLLADRAFGSSQNDSKVARLVRRYQTTVENREKSSSISLDF